MLKQILWIYEKSNDTKLEELFVFTSLEPCPYCFGKMALARVKAVFYLFDDAQLYNCWVGTFIGYGKPQCYTIPNISSDKLNQIEGTINEKIRNPAFKNILEKYHQDFLNVKQEDFPNIKKFEELQRYLNVVANRYDSPIQYPEQKNSEIAKPIIYFSYIFPIIWPFFAIKIYEHFMKKRMF